MQNMKSVFCGVKLHESYIFHFLLVSSLAGNSIFYPQYLYVQMWVFLVCTKFDGGKD